MDDTTHPNEDRSILSEEEAKLFDLQDELVWRYPPGTPNRDKLIEKAMAEQRD